MQSDCFVAFFLYFYLLIFFANQQQKSRQLNNETTRQQIKNYCVLIKNQCAFEKKTISYDNTLNNTALFRSSVPVQQDSDWTQRYE